MHHTRRAHPPVSHQFSHDQESSSSAAHIYRPVSPPKTPPRNRRPSAAIIPNPMSWLGRKDGAEPHKPAYAPSAKPIRISEPHFTNALDLIASPPPTRLGPLGSGATIVRTPMDALAAAGTRQPENNFEDLGVIDVRATEEQDAPVEATTTTTTVDDEESPVLPSLDRSLPPVPLFAQQSERTRARPAGRSAPTPPPTRPPPAPPSEPTQIPSPHSTPIRPSLKQHRHQSSSASIEYFPPVPQVPVHLLTPVAPQPPFAPILVQPLVGAAVDLAKVIVTLESSTVSHRVALPTLLSRPSHLSRWLKSVLPGKDSERSEAADEEEEDEDIRASTYSASDASGFLSLFHNHLNNEGLISAASCSMQVFLDRPSAPYAHILTYLRAPVSDSAPAALPRAAQLTSTSTSRLEALLELRDEATYLGLDELAQLCTEELATRGHAIASRAAARVHSKLPGGGIHARTDSQASTATLLNRSPGAEVPLPAGARRMRRDSDSASDSTRSSASSTRGERDSVATAVVVPPAVAGAPSQASEHIKITDEDAESPKSPMPPTPPQKTEALRPVVAAPRTAAARTVSGSSNQSLVDLYERTPVAPTFGTAAVDRHQQQQQQQRGQRAAAVQPIAASPPPSARSGGSLRTPPGHASASQQALQHRFAQLRANGQQRGSETLKTRPTAQWI